MRHKEERYTFYRTHGGIQRGELVAAVFDHATSRNLDPQLHSHVFMLNVVRTADGGWRGNWNRTIFQDQKSLGLLYRQELARELESCGYRIVLTDRSQMFFELEGVDPRLIEHFSSRREAIECQVDVLNGNSEISDLLNGRSNLLNGDGNLRLRDSDLLNGDCNLCSRDSNLLNGDRNLCSRDSNHLNGDCNL